jgi:hypothetical protein
MGNCLCVRVCVCVCVFMNPQASTADLLLTFAPLHRDSHTTFKEFKPSLSEKEERMERWMSEGPLVFFNLLSHLSCIFHSCYSNWWGYCLHFEYMEIKDHCSKMPSQVTHLPTHITSVSLHSKALSFCHTASQWDFNYSDLFRKYT